MNSTGRPDAVVLGPEGPASLDLVRQLRAAGFGWRIVALTTSAAPALCGAAAATGVDAVLDTAGVTDGWLSALHGTVCGSAHDTPVDGVWRREKGDQ